MKRSIKWLLSVLAVNAGLSVQAADPIRVGLVDETTGPQAEAGVLTMKGAQLAQEEINGAGGIMGRPIELVVEDNQSTNPGSVLAYSKLIEQKVVAVIGPLRSTQVQAVSPTILKSKIPAIIGGSDPMLTRVNNPWIFRVRPSDIYSSRVMADFGVNELKKKKWAVLHSTDTFGNNGKNALVEALKTMGIEPVLIQGYTNNQQDFTAVVLSIKKSGADIIGSYLTNAPDAGILAKQMKQLGVTANWIGSTTLSTETALRLGGDALYGTFAVTDFFIDANAESKGFSERFKKKYGFNPDLLVSWAYSAMYLLKHAVETAKSTEPEAVRKAILSTKGLKGVGGTYNFDSNGDGLHGYSVVRNDQGKMVFVKHVEFDPLAKP